MIKINPARSVKLIFFILGLLLLFALIQKVEPHKILKIMSGAKINFLVYGVLTYLFLILIRAFKWFLLVRTHERKIKFREFLPFYFVNSLFGNITPLKSGEMTTPFLFRKYLKIPVGRGLSIVILDRFFELMIFTLIFLASIIYIINSGVANGLILSVFRWALIGLILLISFLAIIIISKKTSLKILGAFNYFKKYPLLEKFLEFAEAELHLFYDSLSLFKNRRIYKFIISLTVICWFFELLSFYLVVSSVLSASFFNVASAQLVAIAATLLTFIPAGIGIGEIGIVSVLKLFNYSAALGAAGALLARLFITGTLLAVGIIGTFLLKEKSVDSY